MKKMFVFALSVAALAGLAPLPLHAQLPDAGEHRPAESRRFLDYFLSRNRLDQGTELDGIGGRITWPLAARGGAPLLERVSVGGYLVHTPEDAEEYEMLHYGVEADVRVSPQPLAGRVDPLLSLGVGAVRVEEPGRRYAGGRGAYLVLKEPGAAPATDTSLSLVPGLGARVYLLPGVGFRSDLRLVVDFRERTTRNVELSGGLSLPL